LLIVQDSEEAAHQLAEMAVKYLSDYQIPNTLLFRRGDPVEQIIDCANEENADLVAMGAYGHSRIRELVLGSTTESILRQINRAVLHITSSLTVWNCRVSFSIHELGYSLSHWVRVRKRGKHMDPSYRLGRSTIAFL
jgi:hypothetical protein